MGLGKGEGSDGVATLTKSSTIYAFSQTSQPRVMRGWFSTAPLVEGPSKFLSLSLSFAACFVLFWFLFFFDVARCYSNEEVASNGSNLLN